MLKKKANRDQCGRSLVQGGLGAFGLLRGFFLFYWISNNRSRANADAWAKLDFGTQNAALSSIYSEYGEARQGQAARFTIVYGALWDIIKSLGSGQPGRGEQAKNFLEGTLIPELEKLAKDCKDDPLSEAEAKYHIFVCREALTMVDFKNLEAAKEVLEELTKETSPPHLTDKWRKRRLEQYENPLEKVEILLFYQRFRDQAAPPRGQPQRRGTIPSELDCDLEEMGEGEGEGDLGEEVDGEDYALPLLARKVFDFSVSRKAHGTRLDAFVVKQLPDLSRSLIQKSVESGKVTVNGVPAKSSYKVRAGDQICVESPDPPHAAPVPEDIPLDVLYEDDYLALINKPYDMVVHPAKGHWTGTLANALSFRFANLSRAGGEYRPGLVHRLDRDTSGVILVAKEERTHRELSAQFEQRENLQGIHGPHRRSPRSR